MRCAMPYDAGLVGSVEKQPEEAVCSPAAEVCAVKQHGGLEVGDLYDWFVCLRP